MTLTGRRMVPLPNDTSTDSMRVHLSFNTSAPGASLPQGVDSPRFATYDISGDHAMCPTYPDHTSPPPSPPPPSTEAWRAVWLIQPPRS